MVYTPTAWQNLPATTTPVDADNLNKMEAGIEVANRDASTTQKGNVELSTSGEMDTGTSTVLVPTVKAVADYVTAHGGGGGGAGTVTSVNGKSPVSGAVTLVASDVGAATPQQLVTSASQTLDSAESYAQGILGAAPVYIREEPMGSGSYAARASADPGGTKMAFWQGQTPPPISSEFMHPLDIFLPVPL